MRNQQSAEKLVKISDGTVEVHSIFNTIQGEGPYVGVPAVFVRLAGCNIQCPNCDTEYTKGRYAATPEAVVQQIWSVRSPNTKLVVITGGEPFRQPLGPLVRHLLFCGFQVQIETNGTLFQDLPYEDITVVCSPKTGSINRLLASKLNALKYVVDARSLGSDWLPERALDHGSSLLARPPKDFTGRIYLQPYDSEDSTENLIHQRTTVSACMATGYTLCLQTHKIIGLE